MHRRRLLGLAAAGFACAPLMSFAQAPSAVPHRIVVMDFGLTEMLLMLGVTPLATSVPDWYRRTNVAPPLPEGVIDIGLLYQPNFELLEQLRPDLLVLTPAHAPMRAQLERIAPTITLALSAPGVEPWRQIAQETQRLARVLEREPQANAAIADADAKLAAARARIATAAVANKATAPIFVVEFVDDRHLLAYGPGSLFGDVMTRLGLRNAWTGPNNARGYAVTDFTRLADVKDAADARLVYIDPLPDAARDTLAQGVLWRSLPFARAGRVASMPKVSQGGALYSGARFAGQLADVVLSQEAHHA